MKFFSDLFKEPGKDKWSLTRFVFVLCLLAMLIKTLITPEFTDLPATWCSFLLALMGIGKLATWGHDLNSIKAHKIVKDGINDR